MNSRIAAFRALDRAQRALEDARSALEKAAQPRETSRASWVAEAGKMQREGSTLRAIGDQFGVSRQRVQQVLAPTGRLPRAPRPIDPGRLAHATKPCGFSGCSELIGSTKMTRRFCPAHVGCYRKGRAAWPPEQRAKHDALTRRWRLEHPERDLEISRKAQRAYRERQRAKAAS